MVMSISNGKRHARGSDSMLMQLPSPLDCISSTARSPPSQAPAASATPAFSVSNSWSAQSVGACAISPLAIVVVGGALAIFVFVLFHRHRIDAAEPAIEVDVGAALGAERLEGGIRRLAADRAAGR